MLILNQALRWPRPWIAFSFWRVFGRHWQSSVRDREEQIHHGDTEGRRKTKKNVKETVFRKLRHYREKRRTCFCQTKNLPGGSTIRFDDQI